VKDSVNHLASPSQREASVHAPIAQQGDAAHAKPKHFVTEGEKKFDLLTYTGINYGLNVALSLGAVYWANRTHTGVAARNWWKSQWEKIPGISENFAKVWSNRSFFLTGGFAVLLPVKWLEDSKTELVKKFNREIYGEKANTDAAIIQSEREVEGASKQTWASVISSRMLSLAPFYVFTGFLWEHNSPLARMTNKAFYVDKPIIGASRWLGKAAAQATGDTKTAHAIGELQRTSAGVFKEGLKGEVRDPNLVAAPYYFINEAITSGMVAAAMYPITRLTAPLFDKPDYVPPAAPSPRVTTEALQHDATLASHEALVK
jgi:hypothetical protein